MIFSNLPTTDFDGNVKLFPKKALELNPNTLYCFVGCNGIGKSTLIDYMRQNLTKSGAKSVNMSRNPFAKCFAALDDEKKSHEKKSHETYYFSFDKQSDDGIDENPFMAKAMTCWCSTGESIITRLGGSLTILGDFIRNPENSGSSLVIFFDDCDAGTSLDVINEILDVIHLICHDCDSNNILYYFVLTANSYEIARNCQCIDVSTFKPVEITTYDNYKKFVLKSRERKNKNHERYEQKNSDRK